MNILLILMLIGQGTATHGSSNFFNGTTSVDSVLDNNSLDFGANQDFTILAWIKLNSTAATEFRIVNKRSGVLGYEIYTNVTGFVSSFIGDATGYQTLNGVVSIKDNRWHYIGMERKADTSIVIYDGFLAKLQFTRTGDLSNAVNFLIGRYGSATNFFSGNMAKISVFNRALLQSEITWNYNHPDKLFSTANLVLYLPMNEYTGTVLYDSSGLGLNGGMSNSTWSFDTPVKSGGN
jgi:hypothetical protein